MKKTALIITLAAVAAGAAGVTGSTLFLTGTVGDYFKDYTITFEENGGSEVNDVTQLVDSKITIPNDPTKANCKFEGWYSDKDLKEKYTFDKMPGKNITLYAKWSLNKTTITFNSNGGSEVSAFNKIPGEAITAPEAPTRKNYKFVGWFEDEALTKAYTFDKMPGKNITLYAKWQINTSQINFDSNGGTNVLSIKGDIGEVVAAPTAPTKKGFKFAGWYSDSKLTNAYTFNKMPENDITLYAKWEKIIYQLAFNANGGTGLEPILAAYQDTIRKPENPTREGCTFVDWYADEDFKTPFVFSKMPAEDIVVYAKWEFNEYTITFNSNGGTEVASITKLYGDKIAKPTDPTKEGHTFAGWFTDEALEKAYTFNEMGSSDITLYAKWDVNKYDVVFNTNGGSTIDSQNVIYGQPVVRPEDPTKTGYTFDNWYTDSELKIPYTFGNMGAGKLTLYAKWTANKYTITFNSNGGSDVAQIEQDFDTTITKPTDPTKTGHTFSGWFKEPALTNEFVFDKMPASDTTIYAKWTANKYTITFNSNGGSDVAKIEQDFDTVVVKPTDPTKEGCTFAGWFTDVELNTPYVFNKITDNNITLYAKWNANSYDVIYHTNGGTEIPTQTVKYNTKLTAPKDPYLKEFNFAGWFTDEALQNPFVFDESTTMPGHNLDLYAGYTEEALTYSLTPDGTGYVCKGLKTTKTETTSLSIPDKYDDGVNGLKPVKVIGTNAFMYNNKITTVEIPSTVETIEKQAFYGLDFLKTLKLNEGLKTIGESAFNSDEALETLSLPNSLTELGNHAFQSCNALKSLSIGNQIKRISECAFSGCISLNEVTIPDQVEVVGLWAFQGCTNLTKFVSGAKVNILGGLALANCSKLKEVTLNEGLITIDGNAFSNDTNLKSIIIPSTVTTINGAAFENTGITSIIIPNKVISVDYRSFSGVKADIYVETAEQMSNWDEEWDCELIEGSHVYAGKDKWGDQGTYTVSFLANGGTGDCAPITKKYGEPFEFPFVYKSGLRLKGWYDGETKITSHYVPAKDITLEARYWHKIEVYPNDDQYSSSYYSYYIDEGNDLFMPTRIPHRTEATFVGWHLDSRDGQIIDSFNGLPKDNYSLYAEWNVNKFNITYHTDGGTLDNEVVPIEYGSRLELPKPYKLNYCFEGWYLNPELTIENTYDDMPNKHIDLYAKYVPSEEREIRIFDESGQLNNQTVKIKTGQYCALPKPANLTYTDSWGDKNVFDGYGSRWNKVPEKDGLYLLGDINSIEVRWKMK